MQYIEKGLVQGELILTDSTHVKANTSFKKNVQITVEKEAVSHMEQLDIYEAQERAQLEASSAIKPQRAKQTPKEKAQVRKTVSTTEPDAGMLNGHEKPEGMYYLSHQSVDAARGIAVDVAVTPGNANDSESYLERIEYIQNHLGLNIKKAGVDSTYGTSLICQTWALHYTHQRQQAVSIIKWRSFGRILHISRQMTVLSARPESN